MSLIDFVQDELKKARIEALRACSYESICDLLDSQESQLAEKDREIEVLKKSLGESINYVSFDLDPIEALDLFKEAYTKKKQKESNHD